MSGGIPAFSLTKDSLLLPSCLRVRTLPEKTPRVSRAVTEAAAAALFLYF